MSLQRQVLKAKAATTARCRLPAMLMLVAYLQTSAAMADTLIDPNDATETAVQQASAQAAQPSPTPPNQNLTLSGLPLPRFASLKADNVNLRQGPGSDYRILWIFKRAGLPVEILREHEAWRQVRDSDGVTGWVLSSLLSGRRTAIVTPWSQIAGEAGKTATTVAPLPLRDARDGDAGIVAGLEAGVLATVLSCDGRWCRLAIEDYRGYAEQSQLWGVYQDEVIR